VCISAAEAHKPEKKMRKINISKRNDKEYYEHDNKEDQNNMINQDNT
jgi:hypothetical protein